MWKIFCNFCSAAVCVMLSEHVGSCNDMAVCVLCWQVQSLQSIMNKVGAGITLKNSNGLALLT